MAEKRVEERTCPGERYAISPAICRTRQRNQYPKCLLCRHRDPELAGTMVTDPKVGAGVFRSGAVLGKVPDEINEYVIRKVGSAAAQYLRALSPTRTRLAVACDARDNSRGFTRIFCEGVNRGGMDAANLGPAPPELLGHLLATDGCAGAAFVGGCNYAENVSGVRIWCSDGSPMGFGEGLEKVALIARRLRTGCSRLPGETTSAEPAADYAAHVRALPGELAPLKVVLDAGCGSAARLLEPLLAELPIEFVPRHFEEDGHNPFLGKPFPPESVAAELRRAVPEAGADLGVAVDFTGERIAFTDERGRLLAHDVAAGLIATELLQAHAGATVVYDLRASAALRGRIAGRGGEARAAPADPRALARQFSESQALYGAGLSGLHYFRHTFGFPSPAAALLVVCAHLGREGKALSELAGELGRFSRSGEIVIEAPSPEAAQEALSRVQEEFADAERDFVDGVTIRTADYWFNLRRPGERAELRLNVEGRTARDLRRGRQQVERLVSRLLAAAG